MSPSIRPFFRSRTVLMMFAVAFCVLHRLSCLFTSNSKPTEADYSSVNDEAKTAPPKTTFRCDILGFENCLKIIKQVTEKPELSFAINSKDLETACSKLRSGVKCADKWMDNCASKKGNEIFQEVVNGSRQVIQSLCTDGPVRTNYLRFAPCLKDAIERRNDCKHWIQTVSNISIKLDDNRDAFYLKQLCWKSVKCQIGSIKRNCGQEAVHFFRQDLEQMSSNLMSQHCENFMEPSENCVYFNEALTLRNSMVNFICNFVVNLALIIVIF